VGFRGLLSELADGLIGEIKIINVLLQKNHCGSFNGKTVFKEKRIRSPAGYNNQENKEGKERERSPTLFRRGAFGVVGPGKQGNRWFNGSMAKVCRGEGRD